MLSNIQISIQWVVILALAVGLVFMKCDRDSALDRMAELEQQVNRVAANASSLPDGAVTMLQLRDCVAKEISRFSPDSIIQEYHYIPGESEIIYITSTDSVALEELVGVSVDIEELRSRLEAGEQLSSADSLRLSDLQARSDELWYQVFRTELQYKTYGFCWKPQVGFGRTTSSRWQLTLGGRFFFANRYGAEAHIAADIPTDSTETWGLAVGLGADVRIPKMDNVAVRVSVELDTIQEKLRGSLGLSFFLN